MSKEFFLFLGGLLLLCECGAQDVGDLRLVHGSDFDRGRIEIYHNSSWNTICDDGWDSTDADVACRQLGYKYGIGYPGGTFPSGSGKIALDDVNCNGTETRLMNCRSRGWYINNCGHQEDAGVVCFNTYCGSLPCLYGGTCSEGLTSFVCSCPSNHSGHRCEYIPGIQNVGDLRLVDGGSLDRGCIEIYHNSSWNTICNNKWDNTDASVACRQLGYKSGIVGTYPMGSGYIALDDVHCRGTESRLMNCRSSEWYSNKCGHPEDAGVTCFNTYCGSSPCFYGGTCSEGSLYVGKLRLVDGGSLDRGRIEIYYMSYWNTICDDNWDNFDASVACRQLGYKSGIGHIGGTYPSGSGYIALDDVDCDGTETTLTNCRSSEWYFHNCEHSEDAGVTCFKCPEMPRPANGNVIYSAGRTVDVIAIYTCNAGYVLEGPSIKHCQSNGQWTPGYTTCKSKECPEVPMVANGNINYSRGRTVNDTAAYTCNIGYVLQGPHTRQCQSNGQWTSGNATCNLKECPQVHRPANGNVSYSGGRIVNDTAVYTCNAGYTLLGSSTIQCQSNGRWTLGKAICCSDTSQTLAICQKSKVTDILQSISKINITEQNADKVAINVTTELKWASPQILQPQDINSLSTTLESLAHVQNVDSKSFVEIVNNVLDTNTSVLQGSQQQWSSSTRVLHALADHAVKVDLGPSGKTTTVESNVAFAVWNATNLDDLPVAYGTEQDSKMPFAEENVLAYKHSSEVKKADISAGIVLSQEVLQLIASTQDHEHKQKKPIRVSFSIFRKGDLFVVPSNGSDDRQVVIESMVVAATVHNVDTRNLTEPIEIILKTNKKKTLEKAICAHWDFSAAGGQGNWSTEGCSNNGTKGDHVICHCYHLANFAIIGGFDLTIGDGHKTALSIISTIGVSLSLTGLLLTILTFLAFRQFRKNRGQKVLFNLAISLFAVNVTFLASIAAIYTKNKIACKAVAALLQYFLLVSFAWMLVEGVLQYLKVVKVLDTYIPRFMFKASLSAWGIPLIPVVVVAAINHELFLASGKVEYCWLSPPAFYYAFLLPMGLVMIVNIILFSLVIRSFTCNRSKLQSSLPDWQLAKMQFNAAFVCFILLGFTWIFAFISLASDHLVFQYLFCICNAFQGFFIFVFCNIRGPAVHRAWLQFFRFGTTREKWIGLSSTEPDRTATSRL